MFFLGGCHYSTTFCAFLGFFWLPVTNPGICSRFLLLVCDLVLCNCGAHSAKQSVQAMELCHRSRRHGITVPSGIYDLSVQHGHLPTRSGQHASNTAPTGTANAGGLVMANLASDNNNLTLAHQLNALNNHVRCVCSCFSHR